MWEMQHLHDVVHNMSTLLQIVLVVVLMLGSTGDHFTEHGKHRLAINARQDPIDNIGSWLCFALVLLGIVAYHWA